MLFPRWPGKGASTIVVLIKNRWSSIIAFTMVLVLLLGLPAQAAFESAAEAAVLQDYFTGNVLYEKMPPRPSLRPVLLN